MSIKLKMCCPYCKQEFAIFDESAFRITHDPEVFKVAEKITNEVLKKHNIQLAMLLTDSRVSAISIARDELVCRLYQETDLSLREISSIIGRSHGSIHNTINKYKLEKRRKIRRGARMAIVALLGDAEVQAMPLKNYTLSGVNDDTSVEQNITDEEEYDTAGESSNLDEFFTVQECNKSSKCSAI